MGIRSELDAAKKSIMELAGKLDTIAKSYDEKKKKLDDGLTKAAAACAEVAKTAEAPSPAMPKLKEQAKAAATAVQLTRAAAAS